jgi:hypothetical protein
MSALAKVRDDIFASSQVFTQSPQNVAVESGIHSLAYWDRCFALPQMLYRWRHQYGIFWMHPRINICLSVLSSYMSLMILVFLQLRLLIIHCIRFQAENGEISKRCTCTSYRPNHLFLQSVDVLIFNKARSFRSQLCFRF